MKNVKTPIKSLKLTNAQTSYTPGSGRKTPNRQQHHHHHGKENKKSSNKNGNKISPKTPINGDRFIPDRSAMNFEIIHYLVIFTIFFYSKTIINFITNLGYKS